MNAGDRTSTSAALLMAAGIAGSAMFAPVWAHQGHDHGTTAQRRQAPQDEERRAGESRGPLQVGMPAPAFRADLLDGGTFDLAKKRGKVIVLNFWATWCKPCREEMPVLEAFYRAHRAEGLELVAISIETPDDLPKIRRAMKDYSFPAALVSEGQSEAYGRLSRVPVTFVIDRRGVLRFDGLKFAKTLDLPSLERIVTPLLRDRGELVLTASDPATR